MRKIVFVVVLSALATQAQEKSDTARARISDALRRGDTPGVQKVFVELAAGQKPLIPAGAAPVWNTSFEEIRSCGLYAQETYLACVVDIKQHCCFGGGISGAGSLEYVSFFIDWQGDGFQSTDFVGSGIARVPDGSAGSSFAVQSDFTPPGDRRMRAGDFYDVLAKLSWAWPSIMPGTPVPWGNELRFRIRYLPSH